MITLFGITGPWYAWALLVSPAAAAAVVLVIRWWRRRPQWCEDCRQWCCERDDFLCDCCYVDERERAGELRRVIGGTLGGMRAWLLDRIERDNAAAAAGPPPLAAPPWAFALALPVVVDELRRELTQPRGPFELELYREPDDTWGDELEQMNADRLAGRLDAPTLAELAGPDPGLLDWLTDDPKALEWDAAAQAERCRVIVEVQFPLLRARLVDEYAAAAAAARDYWQAAA